MTTVEGLGEHVIAEVIRKEKTEGGIIIPETAHNMPHVYAKVLSIGGKALDDLGSKVEPGDIVVFHQAAGQIMLIDNKEVRVLKSGEIYGILREDK